MVFKEGFQFLFAGGVEWADFLNDVDQPLKFIERANYKTVLLTAE